MARCLDAIYCAEVVVTVLVIIVYDADTNGNRSIRLMVRVTGIVLLMSVVIVMAVVSLEATEMPQCPNTLAKS